MNNYRQVVDEIRSHLQGLDQTLTDRLKHLASEYSGVCETANQRLRRCEEYLAKGLRSEAIQYAQAEPTLLDVVAALDFPERAQFEELQLLYQLPAAPRLQMNTAEALNLAYTEEQPLESRLHLHRRLALARAPLVDRLKVMREMAMLDTKNPVWLEDMREFENARVVEIEALLSAADRPSGAKIHELAVELEQTIWFNRPPDRILTRIRVLQQQQVRDELDVVIDQLQNAVILLDLANAQNLRDKFNMLIGRAALNASDPLLRRSKHSLEWLAEEESKQMDELTYQTDLAAIESALEMRSDHEEVADLYYNVASRGRKIPALLKRRFDEYQAESYRGRRWREWIILVSVILVGLIALSGFIGFIWLRGRGQ